MQSVINGLNLELKNTTKDENCDGSVNCRAQGKIGSQKNCTGYKEFYHKMIHFQKF